jgi:hypothetical protein
MTKEQAQAILANPSAHTAQEITEALQLLSTVWAKRD